MSLFECSFECFHQVSYASQKKKANTAREEPGEGKRSEVELTGKQQRNCIDQNGNENDRQ